jgi:hypothetical protein
VFLNASEGRVMTMRRWRVWVSAAVWVSAVGCQPQSPSSSSYDDEWPMMLAFSDGETYPAEGSIDVDTSTSPPTFTVNVLPNRPTQEIGLGVGSTIAASDVALLTSHATTGGTDVPYGNGEHGGVRVSFGYYVDGVLVHREPQSIRLIVDGATVRLRVTMGAALALDGPVPEGLTPTATAELVGHLAIGCTIASPELGTGFSEGDPTWSSDACMDASRTYGLDVLRSAQ